MTTDFNPPLALSRQNRQAVLDQVNQLAWLLDNSIRIPILNYRIGLDALLGLIPGLGDAAGMLFSSFIVLQAIRLGVQRPTLYRMVGNVVIETLIGLIPLLGDLFDATFKANVRNVRLLRLALDQSSPNSASRPINGKGMLATLIGALIGVVVLIGGASVALVWGIYSLFV